MLKLIKILKFFEIKNKLLEVITNNASNNNTINRLIVGNRIYYVIVPRFGFRFQLLEPTREKLLYIVY